ncbi:SET and MYND domain-containing protein 4 [Armadillidium vulgare]|nr:SET and MYND domain-containing protein 4 [Armadillidium vulgare]
MSSEMDFDEENSHENQSQDDEKKTESEWSQTPNGSTSETNGNMETNGKDLEESLASKTRQHILLGLKIFKTHSKLDLSLQMAKPLPHSQTEDYKLTQVPTFGPSNSSSSQPPPPPSLTDRESLAFLSKLSTSGKSDFSLSQPPQPSSQAGPSLTQPSPPSNHTESSLAQPPLENVVAVKSQGNLEDETEMDSISCDKAHQRELCEQIMRTDPLEGIGDSRMYFAQFYGDLCDRIVQLNLLEKIENEFSAINNDYERIEYILQFEEIKNLKLNIEECSTKSEKYANALEEEYNNCCHSTSIDILNLGLQLINRCIQLTPGTDKKNLGIRIMKRAWVNIMMSKFDEAREDAHRSLGHCSDLPVMWNGFEILGHCYAHIGKHSIAEHFFRQALLGLSESDLDNETKAASAKRISTVFKYVKGRDDLRGGDINCTENLRTPEISYGINRILKCATESVEVKVKKKTGRGLYARRELKPGDVIIVEKPYVSALYRDNIETHCNNCFKRFKSPIPCDTCTRVWFCSEKCLKEGKTGFHSSECFSLNLLYEESIGRMAIIVFRILLRLSWKNIKLLRSSRKIDTRLPDSHPKHTEFSREKYLTDNYMTTYKLVTNSHLRDFCDLFKRIIIAFYLKQCLKEVDFFKGENVSLEDEIFVASLILRHLQNSSCNDFSITEFIVGENTENVELLELGGGIYPTISLINHSCNPNVFRYYIGKNCIVRATKVIRTGEQLLINYGSLSAMLGRESRRAVLKKFYKFDCDCIACEENWPLLGNVDHVYMKIACPEENCDQIIEFDGKENMICPSCGFNKKHENLLIEVKSKIKDFKRGQHLLNVGLQEEAATCVKHFKIYLDKKVIPPSLCLTECEEILKRCFFSQGNLFQSNRN